jgi:fructose-specific phosphotransferase system IIC component
MKHWTVAVGAITGGVALLFTVAYLAAGGPVLAWPLPAALVGLVLVVGLVVALALSNVPNALHHIAAQTRGARVVKRATDTPTATSLPDAPEQVREAVQ